MLIENFEEIRRDGLIITESLTLIEMIERGWCPDKVVKLRWNYGDLLVIINNPYGILAEVIANREMVALISHQDADEINCVLSVVNADGSSRFVIANTQQIDDEILGGYFSGFKPSRIEGPSCFGVVFCVSGINQLYQVDIDALSGVVLDKYLLPWG